ncbi:hypothetical protein DEO72_LG11g1262 [Vigna unguiculata]|uniref:Uncharacterized protein n=1 Tax=Vigna unguiculata TaxID=3917 RepID=A0A4D6NKE8_VIGUN|nr:hypothetical protein DEO72_LG11g1262 [Vigna unguiculata]
MSSEKVLHTSTPLEKALANAFETLNDEEEKKIDECLTNLDIVKEILAHEVNIEELKIGNKANEAKA